MGTTLKILICLLLVAVAVTGVVGVNYLRTSAADHEVMTQPSPSREDAHRMQEQLVLFSEARVPARQPFPAFLQSMGFTPNAATRLMASAQSVFDLRHLRAGNSFVVGRSSLGDLRELRYRIDADRVLYIRPQGNDFHAEVQTIPSETEEVGVVGQVNGSLFNAVLDAGERPELAMRLAEIFGWDMDFYTDPRPGDTFRVVVEKKTLESGEVVSYGRILAAEYNNGPHSYRAVLFHGPNGEPAYYTPDGKSMKKAFLHSPLKFAAVITSHFSQHRYHPILKEYRPHLGIDYAAPTGTPVQTIGDGRVIFAGRKGGAGNLIEIQHSNGYTTYYMHLSRVLVHSGARRAGPADWPRWHDRPGHRPASGFPHPTRQRVPEFRTPPAAAIRSGFEARLERIRGDARPRASPDAAAALATTGGRSQKFCARNSRAPRSFIRAHKPVVSANLQLVPR